MQKTLNTGNYVRTSKGNVGIIVTPTRLEVGFNGPNEWESINQFLSDTPEGIIQNYIERMQPVYPNKILQVATFNNIVKIGDKEFVISSDKLTLIDPLVIEVIDSRGKATIALKTKDADTLLKIFEDNNISYKIV